jgi:hypothetical protein
MAAETVISCDACGAEHRGPGDKWGWESNIGVVWLTVDVPGQLPEHRYACLETWSGKPNCFRIILIRLANEVSR